MYVKCFTYLTELQLFALIKFQKKLFERYKNTKYIIIQIKKDKKKTTKNWCTEHFILIQFMHFHRVSMKVM